MARMMKVDGLVVDPFTNSPIMLLKDEETQESLPIWIGLLEATAIASELEHVTYSRPMTHDLLKNLLDLLGARLQKIEVCDLKENTFFALLTLEREGQRLEVDVRPSDAVALALRCRAPIYVAEQVLEKSKRAEQEGKAPRPVDKTQDPEKLAEILKSMGPEAFGKYKM